MIPSGRACRSCRTRWGQADGLCRGCARRLQVEAGRVNPVLVGRSSDFLDGYRVGYEAALAFLRTQDVRRISGPSERRL